MLDKVHTYKVPILYFVGMYFLQVRPCMGHENDHNIGVSHGWEGRYTSQHKGKYLPIEDKVGWVGTI